MEDSGKEKSWWLWFGAETHCQMSYKMQEKLRWN